MQARSPRPNHTRPKIEYALKWDSKWLNQLGSYEEWTGKIEKRISKFLKIMSLRHVTKICE